VLPRSTHAAAQSGLNYVNQREEIFGSDAQSFDPYRALRKGVPGYGQSFGAGPHVCPGGLIPAGATAAVTKNSDDNTIGILARLLEELFLYDVSLDPEDLPRRRDDTEADRYELLGDHRPEQRGAGLREDGTTRLTMASSAADAQQPGQVLAQDSGFRLPAQAESPDQHPWLAQHVEQAHPPADTTTGPARHQLIANGTNRCIFT
jgi:hypothetical protein